MPSNMTGTYQRPQSSPLTVLFAPAHARVDEAEGGGEYHLPYKLMERLALDHRVQIIALTVQPRVQHHLPGVQFVSIDPAGDLPATNLNRLRFHLLCAAKARDILASGRRIDLIHHMFPFGYRATFNFLALLRRRSDPPVIVGPLLPRHSFEGDDELLVSMRDFSKTTKPTVSPRSCHRRAFPPLTAFATTPVLSALSSGTLRRAEALIAISDRAVRAYRPLIGSKHATVIPFGVDIDRFAPDSSMRNAPDGVNGRAVTILAVGYLVQRKAFDVLIRAMHKLAAVGMPVYLRIVGDGPARSYLEALVRDLGVERSVTFVGLVPHAAIIDEYHRADIFCSTSLSEGFATVALEALACGLPIVATPTGGFRELLTERHVGTLVRFGAVDELAAALVQMITNQPLRETLGRRARELAVREYDWRIIAQRYFSLYQQIVHRNA